jgi:hypothetical protein
MQNYECWVKVPIGGNMMQATRVRLQAMNALAARGQFNAMFGVANVMSLPTQVQ